MDALLNISRLAEVNNTQILGNWIMCVTAPAKAQGKIIGILETYGS